MKDLGLLKEFERRARIGIQGDLEHIQSQEFSQREKLRKLGSLIYWQHEGTFAPMTIQHGVPHDDHHVHLLSDHLHGDHLRAGYEGEVSNILTQPFLFQNQSLESKTSNLSLIDGTHGKIRKTCYQDLHFCLFRPYNAAD